MVYGESVAYWKYEGGRGFCVPGAPPEDGEGLPSNRRKPKMQQNWRYLEPSEIGRNGKEVIQCLIVNRRDCRHP